MEHLHIIENESLRIIVADHGAELVSVWDKESGSERIWTAEYTGASGSGGCVSLW